MRFMVLVKANKESEAGFPAGTPDLAGKQKEIVAEMGRFNKEMAKAGVLLAAEGLLPSSKGVRIRFSGEQRTVIDGPFTESKELVAGFWMIQVKSIEDAIHWIKRCPFGGDTEIEIRQVFETSDFPAAILPPEDAAREEELRDELRRKAAIARL
jgi:hypothetical protein